MKTIIEKKIKQVRKKLDKAHKKNSKIKDAFNKDGSKRKGNAKDRIQDEIAKLEKTYKLFLKIKKELPEKVDISTLEDYKSFKRIDNEGKNLFDFVTSSIWNARKEMTDWIYTHYPHESEYVDLFYAITKCHGRIKSEPDRVVVRLEPLQQSSRKFVQDQFCKRLSALNIGLPIGKKLQIEVGPRPV